jgi:hypothetical protein
MSVNQHSQPCSRRTMNRHVIRYGRVVPALIFTALGAWTVHAEVVDIVWTASGEFERKVRIPPGKFVEMCGPLEALDVVRWTFEATHSLEFNVHYHVGKDVVYPSKQDGVRSARGTLAVPSRQDYCWMWNSRQQTAVELFVTLKR